MKIEKYTKKISPKNMLKKSR